MIKFKADENNVRVLGRTLYRDNVRWLGYSCTAVEFEFTGTKATAELSTDWLNDAGWKHIFQPYMAVFVNDSTEPYKRFAVNEGTAEYELYTSENIGKVKIRLVKMSENAFSKVGINSVSADGEIRPPQPVSQRKIEFVGDSITCGFGIEASSAADGFCTAQENPWINYASITARHFNAEYNLVSWTSIGVLSNSVKEDVNEPDDGWTMPKIYFYTDRSVDGMTAGSENNLEEWDFSRFEPDLIVVNLGTNDKDYTREIKERTDAFEECYLNFISDIRKHNPDSVILCTLGAMGQQLCPQIENAVKKLGDDKIYAVRFDEQLESDGIGAESHPNAVTHKKMAEKLIGEIERLNIF